VSWSSLVTLAVGLAVAAFLFAWNDPAEIVRLVAGAGWGLPVVIALRLPQLLASAIAWGVLIDAPGRPGLGALFRLRWIRDAVNAVLPVAQVGGDVVRARLLIRRGVAAVPATVGVTVDVATELAAQFAFAVIGLAVLWHLPHQGGGAEWAVAATGVLGLMTAGFMSAQRWGLFRLVERLVPRLARSRNADAMAGLHAAVVGLYRQPGRVWASVVAHLASWLFGVLETWVALRILGIEVGLAEALVIESLGQLARSLGFMVPGGLGVQEGGFVLACGLFGIPPEQALALSLVRRIRDIAFGLPGIVAWRWDAAREPAPGLATAGSAKTPPGA
jgi:putative membrane protein